MRRRNAVDLLSMVREMAPELQTMRRLSTPELVVMRSGDAMITIEYGRRLPGFGPWLVTSYADEHGIREQRSVDPHNAEYAVMFALQWDRERREAR